MTRKLITLTALASTLVIGVGCSSVRDEPAPVYGSGAVGTSGTATPTNADVHYGYVRHITQQETTKRSSGAGAILGAVVGGALGNQVGSGSGRTAATVAGAVGGAVVGNKIEENRNRGAGQVYYQVDVRLDNGDFRTFDYMDLNGLRVGDRVRVQDGQLQRW